MKRLLKKSESIKRKLTGKSLVAGFGLALFMSMSCNLTTYAFEAPNNRSEAEPNNTLETAQMTYQTNEIAENFAGDDWSGRHSIYGKADSIDDDWYKVELTAGLQYLSVVHSYGDNATFVELLDSEKNVVLSETSGTGYHVQDFYSNGGTYYIHIKGALEHESQYTLFVGTPMLSSSEAYVTFDPVNTSGTVKRSFSLKDETVLPEGAIVSKITLRNATQFSSVIVKNTSSSQSVSFSGTTSSGNIGSLNMELKSAWETTFYPKTTVKVLPTISYVYFYPVLDNTEYPYLPTIKK